MTQKTLVKLQNKETGTVYYTYRNTKGDRANKKLELKKYDKMTKQHEVFKEVKKLSKKKVVKAVAKNPTAKKK